MREPAAAVLCINVVVVVICGLGIKGGAHPIYPAVSFNLTDATWGRYRDFIAELREIVTQGGTCTRSGVTVLRPEDQVRDWERFVLVNLTDYCGHTATLAVDVVILYVVAFLVKGTSYFFSDATSLQRDNLFVDAQRTLLNYTSNYQDLERRARADRENIPLGPLPLDNAITNLAYNSGQAKSLIVVIQMVSEAARFKHIEVRIWETITAGNTFCPKGAILSMENGWSTMSMEVQRSVDGLIIFGTVQLQDDHYKPIDVNNSNTLSRYTMVAVLLYRCLKTTSGSYGYNYSSNIVVTAAHVMNDPMCAILQPTKRISGRDGLCVDVKDGQNNDRNAIQLSECGEQISQQWTFHKDETIRSMRKCMTTNRNSFGVYAMIHDCSTAILDATKWTISVDGTINNRHSGLVLTAPKATNGTTLLVVDNVHDARQGWTVGNHEPIVTYILGMNMTCLEAKNENNALSLEDCQRNLWEQKWAIYSDGTIRVHTNRSLCVTSDGNFSRAAIIIRKCQGSPNQRWVFNNANLTILNPNSKLVMDVETSDVSLQIILYQPTGNPNQQWLTHTNLFE